MTIFFALLLSFSALADTPACDDTGKVYKACADQGAVYDKALAKAMADRKNLVVVLGAEWCPWCLSLHKILKAP